LFTPLFDADFDTRRLLRLTLRLLRRDTLDDYVTRQRRGAR